MDPITLLGIVGSVASVISLFRRQGIKVTAKMVTDQVIAESIVIVEDGGAASQRSILDKVSEAEIENVASDLIKADSITPVLNDRIANCFAKFADSKANDNEDFDEAYQIARRCICASIRIARDGNGGVVPDHMKKYWKEFNCLNLQ